MEQETKKITEKKRDNLEELFNAEMKLPKNDWSYILGVIIGLQLATAEKAG